MLALAVATFTHQGECRHHAPGTLAPSPDICLRSPPRARKCCGTGVRIDATAPWLERPPDPELSFSLALTKPATDRPEQADPNAPHRIYVAGPYTAPTAEGVRANTAAASAAAVECMRRGHLAHCPHTATAPMDTGQLGYEDFMRLDFSIIGEWATAILYLAPSPAPTASCVSPGETVSRCFARWRRCLISRRAELLQRLRLRKPNQPRPSPPSLRRLQDLRAVPAHGTRATDPRDEGGLPLADDPGE